MTCYRRLELLTCRDFAKEKVKKTIRLIPGPCKDPLTIGKQDHQDLRKKNIMQGAVRRWRKRGGQERRWGDDIREEKLGEKKIGR